MNESTKKLLEKDNKLFTFHSGGGFVHLGYGTEHDEIFWLINPTELIQPIEQKISPEQIEFHYDWVNKYPENEHDFCMFGLDFNNMDSEDEELALNVIGTIEKKIGKHLCFRSDSWSCHFYAVFSEGLEILQELSNKIDQEIFEFFDYKENK